MSPATFVPENAPFSPEQRAWLNEFFSSVYGSPAVRTPHGSATQVPELRDPEPVAAPSPDALGSEPVVPLGYDAPSITYESNVEVGQHDAPWHDPSLDMNQRLALAKGRPLKLQLMAAMAQYDCGACGYLCQTYSEAIANGHEACLDLCAPGGNETEQQLRKIIDANQILPIVSQAVPVAATGTGPSIAVKASSVKPSVGTTLLPTTLTLPGFDRKQPVTGRLVFAKPLNGRGSSKDTRHVAIRFDANAPAYRPGDALGIFPTNDPTTVEQILSKLRIDGLEMVKTGKGDSKTIFGALVQDCCLKVVTEGLAERVGMTAPDRDVWEAVMGGTLQARHEPLDAQTLCNLLRPLQPRLYSISSSPKKYPSEIHLTVGRVQWTRGNRTMLGVASNMLATRLSPRESLQVFVHRPQAFHMPVDPNVPIIMVGPGTGIAPFMGFLQEREATKSSGRNWLFFGDQHAATDFLYEDQIREWQKSGVLNRLETAFSRDQSAKVYVQDRLLEHGREVYRWLQEGAHVYVCGDAKSMAASVQLALQQILATYGGVSLEAAGEQIKELQKQQRYQRDVY